MSVKGGHPAFCTDFGMVNLPEGDWPTRKVCETRYNEFTGKPYKVTFDVPDYRGAKGKLWKAYEEYIQTLAEHTYRQGGDVSELVVVSFSDWSKGREL